MSLFRSPIWLVLLAIGAASCGQTPAEYLARGNRYVEAKKYPEAIVEYLNAIRLEPQNGEARFRLGQAYEEVHNYPSAAQQYVNAAELMPTNVAAQIKGASMFLLGRKFDEARTCAERALRQQPKNVVALVLHANAMAGLKRSGAALADIQRAIALDPTRSATYSELGVFQFANGAQEQAEENLKKAADQAQTSAEPHLTLASLYWAQGRMGEAEAELKRAVGVEPSSVLANRALATFYLGAERPSEAEKHLKAIVAADPTTGARLALADYYIVLNRSNDAISLLNVVAQDREGYGEARSRIAAIAYEAGRQEEAHRILDETLAQDKSSSRALMTKSQFLLVEQKSDEALELLKASVAADSRSIPAHYMLATFHAANQDPDAAVREFNEVLKLNPQALAAKMELARLHLANGDPALAADFARQVVAAKPQNVEAGLLFVRALVGNGETTRAQSELATILKTHPDRADVQAQSGNLQMRLGEPEFARQAFQRALAIDPDAIEALNGIVMLDVKEGNLGRARGVVEERLNRRPNDSALLLLAARAYQAAGAADKTEDALRKAIETDPTNSEAYDMLGQLYMSQQKVVQAIAQFEELARRDTKSVAAHTMVGLLLQAQNRPAAAQESYQRALDLNPRAAVAANNLAWLYAEGGGNLDLALQLAQIAKEQLPELPDVNDTLGWVYYRKDLPQLAVGPMQLSIERDPTNPTYRYHIGLAYMKTGDLDLAKEALEHALKLNPDFDGASDARKLLSLLQ